MGDDSGRRPAVVVGAGPVGLAAALALRARGLPALILEAEPGDRVRPGSRAIYVHGATLRLLERVRAGLGWRLAERGVVWPTRRTLWRGREVFRRTYDPARPDTLPHFTSLPQVEVERILLAECIAAGADVEWSQSVTNVEVAPDGVALKTDAGDVWKTEYVIAADGARSAVRSGIGSEMEGSRSSSSYVIVDVTEDQRDPLPLERVFHYQHPAAGGRNVLLVPFAGGWRADLQCLPADDPDDFSGEGATAWIDAVLGAKYAERLSWVSTYQFLQVVADSFVDTDRRVLLVGEAAHLFAPFGARGMNSGIADADAAADAVAIALAVGNIADATAAVDRFASDRESAARFNRDAAGKALAHLQPRHWWDRARLAGAAALAPRWGRIAEWLDDAPYGPRGAPPTRSGSKY